MARPRLEEIFVFLAARRRTDVVERLMAFEGKTRRPPLGWAASSQIVAWAGRHPSGRALSAAIASFWSEAAPLLASPETSCPAAFASWRQDQAVLVAHIEKALSRGKPKP